MRTSTLRCDLRSILADGSAYSVMVGIGETYVPAVAMVVGALLGAAVMHGLGDGRRAYLAVFFLSSLARAVALVVIPRRWPRRVERDQPAGFGTIAVRPLAGSMERPMLLPVSEDSTGLSSEGYTMAATESRG